MARGTKLQVKINGRWKYVFCRNTTMNDPVTTHDAQKAITGDALNCFQTNFANHEFRVVMPMTKTRAAQLALGYMWDFLTEYGFWDDEQYDDYVGALNAWGFDEERRPPLV